MNKQDSIDDKPNVSDNSHGSCNSDSEVLLKPVKSEGQMGEYLNADTNKKKGGLKKW